MIYIGTDIINVKKVKSIIDKKGIKFLNHIYSKHEQNICDIKPNSHIHYSGKFAAKEAVKKAILSSKNIKTITLKSIIINNDINGMPFVEINNNIKYKYIKVSISHSGDYATAFALIEI